jgi:uncharacterized protein (TIGR00369 family)
MTQPDDPIALMPFAKTVGVRLDDATPLRVTGHLAWDPNRCTAGGVMHGGALMTLADSIGAVCAFLNLPEGASTATVTSSTSLVRGLREGTAHAAARPLHVGRSFITVVTDLTDDDGRLLAQVTQTQAVIPAR